MTGTLSATDVAIGNVGEAELVIANLNETMDRLAQVVAEETRRVRAGELRASSELDETKAELARRYAAETDLVKAAKGAIAKSLPESLGRLRRRHEAFQTLLQTNLTVLATAHAVSEGIIRGVSGELARKQAPSTYGATGRTNTPGSKTSQPLAISRKL
jgi:flagellar biosynthesis/type III secretory pathway chaperone